MEPKNRETEIGSGFARFRTFPRFLFTFWRFRIGYGGFQIVSKPGYTFPSVSEAFPTRFPFRYGKRGHFRVSVHHRYKLIILDKR
ncbi:hypothetical protein RchiOBHm_Chr3g0482051 [Rosa chinensis]|uniref:Uncharacterized protein n=1 Tax=Rosa chinensis TaxID=74649 RepID=A0A2P6RE61_ROSCH|nr:hypothetical protein RchiOBHm_Chr3g0482051 [Rosa chinensis]